MIAKKIMVYLDKLFLKFFSHVDNVCEDIANLVIKKPKNNKKKKCKSCHCNCHCSIDLHNHWYDDDICVCEGCQCQEKIMRVLEKLVLAIEHFCRKIYSKVWYYRITLTGNLKKRKIKIKYKK